MNRCPKCCGTLAMVVNCDDESCDVFEVIWIKCSDDDCGYVLTFGGLLSHAESVVKYLDMWPDGCSDAGLEINIKAMGKTIAEGI